MAARKVEALAIFVFIAISAFGEGTSASLTSKSKLLKNPVALQFREHVLRADANRDGIVTKEELTQEIENETHRDAKSIERSVSAMMDEIDRNSDGKLSRQEVEFGVQRTAEKANLQDDVSKAQEIMHALAAYRAKHSGNFPHSLEDPAMSKLVSPSVLVCAVADGSEKEWIFKPQVKTSNVVLCSPGPVDSEGQYVVGMTDGRVVGVEAGSLQLEQLPSGFHLFTTAGLTTESPQSKLKSNEEAD